MISNQMLGPCNYLTLNFPEFRFVWHLDPHCSFNQINNYNTLETALKPVLGFFNFSRKQTLASHILSVHDKVRRFACDQCDARFSQVNKLGNF